MSEQPNVEAEDWSAELDVVEDENYRPDPSFQGPVEDEKENGK